MADLLQAIKDGNLAKTKALLETAGENDISYERYQEGTWGAHDRESPIHAALFNMRPRWIRMDDKRTEEEKAAEAKLWREIVIQLIKKGAKLNASYEVRFFPISSKNITFSFRSPFQSINCRAMIGEDAARPRRHSN